MYVIFLDCFIFVFAGVLYWDKWLILHMNEVYKYLILYVNDLQARSLSLDDALVHVDSKFGVVVFMLLVRFSGS